MKLYKTIQKYTFEDGAASVDIEVIDGRVNSVTFGSPYVTVEKLLAVAEKVKGINADRWPTEQVKR